MNSPRKPHQRPRGRPARVAAPPQRGTTHWGDVAQWYDTLVGDEGSEYHREVILPGVMRMLTPDKRADAAGEKIKNQKSKIENLAVLDLACGQGVLCRKLAAADCRVTGIDAAAPLIDAARQRNEVDKLPIEYRVADATTLLVEGTLIAGLVPASFDGITIVLAIQNITPLSPVWQACRALLKPAGKLIVIMMHPSFRVPRQSDWLWEDSTATQARVVRQYLSSSSIPIQTHPGLAAHGKSETTTTHFHRPLQAYINTLGNTGLLIDHIEEWPSHKTSQPGPRQAALDRARKEIPMFLAIRAVKSA